MVVVAAAPVDAAAGPAEAFAAQVRVASGAAVPDDSFEAELPAGAAAANCETSAPRHAADPGFSPWAPELALRCGLARQLSRDRYPASRCPGDRRLATVTPDVLRSVQVRDRACSWACQVSRGDAGLAASEH